MTMTREEAFNDIDNVREVLRHNGLDLAYDVLTIAEQSLKEERKTGRWILCGDEDNGNAMYKCSLCYHSDIQAKSQKVPYCWWCGAEMVKEGAEE